MAYRTDPAKVPSLAWGTEKEERSGLESVERLDELLDDLQQKAASTQPFIVELIVPKVGTLTIGLGLDDTVLSYTPASGVPPYLRSAGPSEHGSDLIFRYYDEWTEFPREHAVPLIQGRAAMRVFVRKGTLSSEVMWVEV